IRDFHVTGVQTCALPIYYGGAGQFGTIAFGQLATDKRRTARIGHSLDGLDRSLAAFGRNGVEGGGTHGDDLDGVGRLHGGDGIRSEERRVGTEERSVGSR